MRIIASVQSKRGSSRGLVHYLAHSKIEPDKEPEKGRELFNAFTDQLDVRNANNFLKSNCGKGRPTNDELHHMVLSFKPEDFHNLGSTDEVRKRRLKAVTRFAISQLEKSLHSERLAWAGAVHLNTANPHVHIAIQKRYLTKELETKSLNKIPREALPHFEIVKGQKQIVDGIFIESAKTKLEELIAQHRPSQKYAKDQSTYRSHEKTGVQDSVGNINEREELRLGILAEFQLKFKEERISFLIQHRENLKFPVSDPETGLKHKVSIKELESAASGLADLANTPEARQIRAITHSILAKEESEFFKLNEDTAEVRKKAELIRKSHKNSGTKLPSPALRKNELDDLQDQCLASSQMREFMFLENLRIELETRKEIEPRGINDLEKLTAEKTLRELRLQHQRRKVLDFKDNSYYRKVPVGNERISLAMIDRESKAKDAGSNSVLQDIRYAIQSLTSRESRRYMKSNKGLLTEAVHTSLNEQLVSLKKDLQTCRKVDGVLNDVLRRNATEREIKPKFSAEELLEIDVLARRLRLPKEYSANWTQQKKSIAEINETTLGPAQELIVGRTIAREVLCKIELNKAKEDLAYYRKSKRFHKFAVEDKKDGSISYLSLNDVDLPRNKSVLDQTFNLLLESKDHRQLRREIELRVKTHERGLKADLVSAKQLSVEASKEAAEYSHNYWWQSSFEPTFQPIFTEKEAAEVEKRIDAKLNGKEAIKLRQALEKSSTGNSGTFDKILQTFMSPDLIEKSTRGYAGDKESKKLPVESQKQDGREMISEIQR